ncbi:MAG TPA: hypothetical protein DCP08_04200 [Chloroflexi bacterium]|nr:hypothetical protein [Chloroflexota bacterium]
MGGSSTSSSLQGVGVGSRVVVPSKVDVGRGVAVVVGSGGGEVEARGVRWATTVGEGLCGSAGASSHLKMTKANVMPTERRASKIAKRRERLEDILPPSERIASL